MLRFMKCNETTINQAVWLRAEAQGLIRDGKMPTLRQVLDTIGEVKRNPAHTYPCEFDDDPETMIRNRRGG